MFNFIKKLFSSTPAPDFADLAAKGAIIIDVRTPQEYKSGHIKGSLNIPLQTLTQNLNKIKQGKPIITCCASGMRSSSAKGILRAKGYTNVHNGGSWHKLMQYQK